METEFNAGGNPSLEILAQYVKVGKRLNRREKQLGKENSSPVLFFFTHLDLSLTPLTVPGSPRMLVALG